VLEVKGGAIRNDPATDRWFTNDQPLNASPFEQVQRIRYSLRDMLANSGASGIEFPLGEAVAFPGGLAGTLPAALLPERVIFAADLENLEAAIVAAFEVFDLRDNADRFGKRGIKALTEAVAGSIEIRRHIGKDIQAAEDEMVRLTEEQYSVLEQLEGNQRVCVLGGAGTGKTLLAMEQARRLAAQGHRVLLTCFNAPLGAHIRGELGPVDGVTVLHFHNLCRIWAREAGLDADQHDGESDADYWDVRLPGLLTEAVDLLDRSFDAILVDEAQDFLPDWIAALQLLLADEQEGLLFLFADQNQAI